MSNANYFIPQAKAKVALKAAITKGGTSAKSAAIPTKKAQAFEKSIGKAAAANARWERPNLLAMCRKLAGTDLAAAWFLHHIFYVWRNRKSKLERNVSGWQCIFWLAHSRDAWAAAAGLTSSELIKRALPRLKKNCNEFLMIRAMGRGSAKKLWVSVDEVALREFMFGSSAMPWEMFHAALNAMGPGHEKQPANAYDKEPK